MPELIAAAAAEVTKQLQGQQLPCSPVVAGHDDVHARAGLADVGHLLIIHFAHGVSERSRGIDNTLGSDIELLPWERNRSITHCLFLLAGLFVIHLSATQPTVTCTLRV